MTWRLELSGRRSGTWNMERDAAAAHACAEGALQPTLRLYGWQPWAVSLGVHQRPTDIDADAARRLGFDIVSRPTGGRAILHADELTYAVVVPANGRSMGEVYRWVNSAFLAALSSFGVHADLESSQPDFRAEYRDPRSAVCFTSAARYEVKVYGRKLIGSAQRRFRGRNGNEVVLQHGSLLLGPGHEQIVDVLAGLSPEAKTGAREMLKLKSITVGEILGRTVSMEAAADVVRAACSRSWGAQFEAVTTSDNVFAEATT